MFVFKNKALYFARLIVRWIFSFLHPTGEVKMAHPFCCKGRAVGFYSFTLCAARLHHFDLVKYAGGVSP